MNICPFVLIKYSLSVQEWLKSAYPMFLDHIFKPAVGDHKVLWSDLLPDTAPTNRPWSMPLQPCNCKGSFPFSPASFHPIVYLSSCTHRIVCTTKYQHIINQKTKTHEPTTSWRRAFSEGTRSHRLWKRLWRICLRLYRVKKTETWEGKEWRLRVVQNSTDFSLFLAEYDIYLTSVFTPCHQFWKGSLQMGHPVPI